MQYTIILEADPQGGFFARCIEIPGALCHGETQNDAFACLREEIERVRAELAAKKAHEAAAAAIFKR